ncbi:hypothetical protein [Streptomyces sp. NPDC054797]
MRPPVQGLIVGAECSGWKNHVLLGHLTLALEQRGGPGPRETSRAVAYWWMPSIAMVEGGRLPARLTRAAYHHGWPGARGGLLGRAPQRSDCARRGAGRVRSSAWFSKSSEHRSSRSSASTGLR